MEFKAYGKINLSLDVTGILDNGYHSVSMVMQSVELCNIVNIKKKEKGTIVVKSDNPYIPEGKDSLVYRACDLMIKEYNLTCGFEVFISTNLPVAGGMAAGSSDAAAVIRGINEICELGASMDELMNLGVTLGADIPFCIQIKPAFAEGIGEKLTNISALWSDLHILVVNPGYHVSTKEIYQRIDSYKKTYIVDNKSLIQALSNKNLLQAKLNMKNVMQDITSQLCPKINEIIDCLYENGAEVALMSGSGATCYGIFTDEKTAITAKNKLKNNYDFVALTKPIE